jgi:hypothetical protein
MGTRTGAWGTAMVRTRVCTATRTATRRYSRRAWFYRG